MKRNVLIIVVLVTLIAIWYAYNEYNRTAPNLVDKQATVTVDALALLKSFENDSAAAVKQYNEKIIAVTGNVKKIESDGNPVVFFLGDAGQMSSVQCSMDSSDVANYKTLKSGTAVTIKGQVAGFRTDPLFGTDVILNRCVVAQP